MARATLRVPVSGLVTTYSYGVSRYRFRDSWAPLEALLPSADGAFVPEYSTPFHNTRKTSDYVTLGGDIRPATADQSTPWSLGYAWTARRASFHIPNFLISAGSLSEASRDESGALSYGTVFGDRRWRYGSRVELEAGVRVDAGGNVAKAPAVRPAPSLQARYLAGGSTFVSAGVGRSYQYTQSIANIYGVNGDAGFGYPLLAGSAIPAVLADQLNVGVEHWGRAGVLTTANVYGRRLGSVAERSLPTSSVMTPALLSITTVRAYGAELGARKLTGPVTGMVNYSFSRAVGDDGRQRYTASGELRHALDVTAMLRHGGMHYGAAFTATSGPPFTQINQGTLMSDSMGVVSWRVPPVAGARNAQHAPAFASLDLLTDWTFVVRGVHTTTFAQVQNALNRNNASQYFPGASCGQVQGSTGATCVGPDVLINRVDRRYGFGLRLTF